MHANQDQRIDRLEDTNVIGYVKLFLALEIRCSQGPEVDSLKWMPHAVSDYCVLSIYAASIPHRYSLPCYSLLWACQCTAFSSHENQGESIQYFKIQELPDNQSCWTSNVTRLSLRILSHHTLTANLPSSS